VPRAKKPNQAGAGAPPGPPEDLFRALFDQHYLPIQRFFARHGVVPEECKDLAQETFFKVHRHLATYRGEASLRTWIFTIALNQLLNLRRSRGTRKREGQELSLDLLLESGQPLPAMAADSSQAPLGNVLRDERSRLLRRELRKLPPQMRRCVLLRVQDLRYREIADVLDVSIDTVKAHLYQARQLLKGRLTPYFRDVEE
jgi:RNA polymerase sigma-70 factor (ECF subfamily)